MSTSPSTSNCHSTICLPAHILDAAITPRAREVLMLLASQTSVESPTLWICQATIAARLRCSPATIARALQKLIEEKLLAETGLLHQGRYKFYHVRWSRDENIKAASKKITKPVRKLAIPAKPKLAPQPFEGVQLTLPPVVQCDALPLPKLPMQSPTPTPPPPPPAPLPSAPPSTIMPQAILKDSRIAHYAEIARKRHQENQRLHQSMLLSLR